LPPDGAATLRMAAHLAYKVWRGLLANFAPSGLISFKIFTTKKTDKKKENYPQIMQIKKSLNITFFGEQFIGVGVAIGIGIE